MKQNEEEKLLIIRSISGTEIFKSHSDAAWGINAEFSRNILESTLPSMKILGEKKKRRKYLEHQ